MSANPLHPIVVYFGRLGDMLMLRPLLALLHRRYRRPCVVLGVSRRNEDIYRSDADVAAVWSFRPHRPLLLDRTWWQLRPLLHGPGPVYVCEDHPRRLARIRRLLWLSAVDPARCLFVVDQACGDGLHWIDRFLRLGERTPAAFSAADYPLPAYDARQVPRLSVLDEERASCEAWLRAQHWLGRPLVLIQPGNHRSTRPQRGRWRRPGADDKAWPLPQWLALIHKIAARIPEALIMLCGTQLEAGMLREIAAAAGSARVVAPALPLRRLFALCEVAHSMISVDTGPAHAAAALGLPLVVMFGPYPPQQWGPRSSCGSPVVGVGGPPLATRVDAISADEVFAAWCTLPAVGQAAPAGARIKAS